MRENIRVSEKRVRNRICLGDIHRRKERGKSRKSNFEFSKSIPQIKKRKWGKKNKIK